MSYKMSKEIIEKCGDKWSKNLKQTSSLEKARRKSIPNFNFSLFSLCKMPLKKHILGRFFGLFVEKKDKKERKSQIAVELIELWGKLNFPSITKQSVISKVSKAIDLYEKQRKRKNSVKNFEIDLENVFDITKKDGLWLSNEDKQFYLKQIESGTKIGYATMKSAPTSIHPSKRIINNKASTSTSASTSTTLINSDTSINDSESDEYVPFPVSKPHKKYQCTTSAANLVTKQSLSTNKASNVCRNLAEDGNDVPTPTQSGVWRRVIQDGEKKKIQIKMIIANEKTFCIHFDGKRLSNIEYQVVCFQSPTRCIKLGILKCESGSSMHVFEAIEDLLDQYEAWGSIKMIICDTTAVNTGRLNGVVVRLQRKITNLGFVEPQYIGCQHHILDLILRHTLNFFVPTITQKPNLNYKFVDEISENYNILQASYKSEIEIKKGPNPGWRNDFKFLFELCEAFQFYKEHQKFPNIKFYKLPSLHNARWNSRGTFALLAYFLWPKWRKKT